MMPCDMNGKKVSTCLYIDRKILEAAKKSGLNLSRVSENALVEAIGRLEGRVAGAGECGGRDSDPRRPPPEDLKSSPLS